MFDKIPVGPATLPIAVPREFDRLLDLASNLWWVWNAAGYGLWSRIDPIQWAENRNPLSLLPVVEPSTWNALSASSTFTEHYQQVVAEFDAYMSSTNTWFTRSPHAERFTQEAPVAYLCAEFGLHHTLPFYSGGLGVLAGDHMKAASDLGVPLVGVGLMYRRGYFHQTIDPDGNQQHEYANVEVSRRPLRQVLDRSRHPLLVDVELPGRTVKVGAWRLDVGRVPLLLLDTDINENDPADRPITNILYVRGREMRLCQELILGIGSVRLLDSLGIEPSTWHVNEGHSAFSLLERLRTTSAAAKPEAPVEESMSDVRSNTLFTLHTPVPAGNEVFDAAMVERYLTVAVPDIPHERVRHLGTGPDGNPERFDMGGLAMRFASKVNGVSRRHGEVVNRDWHALLPGEAMGITNGIHTPTWLGRSITRLLADTLGSQWIETLVEPDAWKAIDDIPAKALWEAHQTQKGVMLRNLRARLVRQAARHGESPDRLRWLDDQLPADRLTIVFARRFATYKRAALLFSDPGRIRWLLMNPDRPVQLIFAGKAHPADREGQGLIRWVDGMARSADIASHLFFIEDYDMALGHSLVGGADVWLNNPRPPLEASGTSGMKAAANGGLNLSVLDGWWLEGFDGDNGWGFSEHSASDAEDAGILYHLLESDVVPTFYDRDSDGVPQAWVAKMKAAITSLTPAFSAHRMMADYTELAYAPLAKPRS